MTVFICTVKVAEDCSGSAAVMIWPLEGLEAAADLADEHVPGLEADVRVDRARS